MKEELNIDYRIFISKLNEEFEALKAMGNFSAIKHLHDIVATLREMQSQKFVPRTCELLHYDASDLEAEVKSFLDPFFLSFGSVKDCILEIEKQTGGFFAFEKAYQLSHARRVWRNQIDEKKEVSQDAKNYFLGRIYTDCYETLPLALSPMIKYHWISKGNDAKKVPKAVFETYQFIIKCLGKSAFSDIEIDEEFRKLRNDLSHSSMLFKGNEVFVLEKDHNSTKRSRFKVFPQMRVMMNLLVIYMTEIDIRIMETAFSSGNDHFDPWMRYFEKYIYWFNKNLGATKS